MNEDYMEISKKLLILTAQTSALKNVEIYLKNRQWELTIVTDLKQALHEVIQGQPRYIMLSLSTPNPKVKNLAAALMRMMPCCTIIYNEASTTQSIRALDQLNHPYTLYPMISGPAIERMIQKFEKDQSQKETSNDGINEIKGNSTTDANKDSEIIRLGNKPQQNLDSLMRFLDQSNDSQDNLLIKEKTAVQEGTQQVLEDVLEVGSGEVKESLEQSSNIACITVESPKFSGYLIAAMGKNRSIDPEFVKLIRERLTKFLRAKGEQVEDGEAMNLKLKEVDFEDWALEYADFLKKSVHNGDEVAFAFIPTQEVNTKYIKAANADMIAISIDEFKNDVEVEFNLYLFFPKNEKYYLYTAKGFKFFDHQRERLRGQGVTHVHILKADLNEYKKYRAQNFLNSKIEEFENKKTEQNSISEKKAA